MSEEVQKEKETSREGTVIQGLAGCCALVLLAIGALSLFGALVQWLDNFPNKDMEAAALFLLAGAVSFGCLLNVIFDR